MIPVGDYVRDALAVLFLLLPLGMAWDFEHQATGHDLVIPVTLLSIISLALSYLKAASVLPQAMSPASLQLVRVLANLPYVIVVLLTLVRGYVGGPAEEGAGVGVGVALGLVGVLLAAQGRALDGREDTGESALSRGVVMVIAGLSVVLAALSTVLALIEFDDDVGWSGVAVVILNALFFAGVPLIAVHGLVKGDAAWRDVTVILGGVGLLAALWAAGADETMGDAWSLRLGGPQFLLWPALGAAAVGVSASLPPQAGTTRWVNLPGRLFQTVTLVALLAALNVGLRLVENVNSRGQYITGLVLSLIALVMATAGRNALVRDARTGRTTAIVAALTMIVLAILEMAILGISQSTEVTVDLATTMSIWFVFAIVVLVALTMPDEAEGTPPATPLEDPDVHAEDESIWEVNTDDTRQ